MVALAVFETRLEEQLRGFVIADVRESLGLAQEDLGEFVLLRPETLFVLRARAIIIAWTRSAIELILGLPRLIGASRKIPGLQLRPFPELKPIFNRLLFLFPIFLFTFHDPLLYFLIVLLQGLLVVYQGWKLVQG